MIRSGSGFFRSLKIGDLVAVHNLRASYVHILRIRYFDERKKRAYHNVGGQALCGALERNGYWSHPEETPDRYNLCPPCIRVWRKLGKPKVRGMGTESTIGGFQPPTAWRETRPTGVPGDDTPPSHKHTNREEGTTLKELRRWVRGSRYVRLCALQGHPTHKFEIRHGYSKDQKRTDSSSWMTSTEGAALDKAHIVMALGGSY